MIARTWRGRARAETAEAYARHFAHKVLPELRNLAGHRGAYLIRHETDDIVEFTAITLWESRESIVAFAGADISRAHVEPEARAVLLEFDAHADHYEVVVSSAP